MRTCLWLWIMALLCGFGSALGAEPAPPVLGQVPDFSLTDQHGQPLHGHDLRGTAWIADFIYTTCPGPCPLLTQKMAALQRQLPPGVRLVSFSVDPATDTPAVLARYAQSHGADDRWSFLTGAEADIQSLGRNAFHMATEHNGSNILHSNYFVLVDGGGAIRGYYDSTDAARLPQLVRDLALLAPGPRSSPYAVLPTVDACFNGLSAFLVLCGFMFIRRHNVPAHRLCMIAAFVSSSLFLTGYLVYHAHVGMTRFPVEGPAKVAYLAILLSHTILAVVTVPLVLTSLSRALRGRFERHKMVARWTFPIWLYVSCTGVVVYVMLYHLYPASSP